jgi:hypothetical protein
VGNEAEWWVGGEDSAGMVGGMQIKDLVRCTTDLHFLSGLHCHVLVGGGWVIYVKKKSSSG